MSTSCPAGARPWVGRFRSRAETIPVIAHIGQRALALNRPPWLDVAGRRRPRWREDQEVCGNAVTPPRGTRRHAQPKSDHAYTQAWSASPSVPDRPPLEEKVMARKKDKKAQKDKKARKTQSAQGAPAAAETTVAPSNSPRPKKS